MTPKGRPAPLGAAELTPLDSLRCFVAAAEHLNFRTAARAVALTPAALGQRIRQLEEVDTGNVEPMTRVVPIALKQRPDEITEGGIADDIVKNAPVSDDHLFVVPKVVE